MSKTTPSPEPEVLTRFEALIRDENYDELIELGREAGVPGIEILVLTLQDFRDNEIVDQTIDHPHPPFSFKGVKFKDIFKMYDRVTDVGRIKEALGHNLGDVVDVFPFQAGCVPFLVRGLKDALKGMDGMPEEAKEIIIFFVLMMFSSLADNYVACKIGLEIFPDKPFIPLIAAIQGGSLSSLGNMANVAQFSLDKFPLADSFKNVIWHSDTVAVSFLWMEALNIMKNLGIWSPPAPLQKGAGESHDDAEEVSSQPDFVPDSAAPIPAHSVLAPDSAVASTRAKISRRGFFAGIFNQEKQPV